MSIRLSIEPRLFHFRQPAGTSRGVYTTRRSWLVTASDTDKPDRIGVGECAPLPDLSCDATPDYEAILRRFCDMVEQSGSIPTEQMRNYPSMLFGIETALLKLQRGDIIFDTTFSRGIEGIPINGLVWMGSFEEMAQRMQEKIDAGFRCIKIKIGAIDFDKEVELLRLLRSAFNRDILELRVDANGAFSPSEAPQKLKTLARFDIHSIEQPIRQGQWDCMAKLCRTSPIDIALDEELIGINDSETKSSLLDEIRPQYIILKPSLHGGINGCREWIDHAKQRGIGSWITSALESNIGLDAIAQFTANVYGPDISMPQGLGTGALFTDNIPMPLSIIGDSIYRRNDAR